MDLPGIVDAVRRHPGLTGKLALASVAAVLGGDGDDAAIISDVGEELALAGEAINPAFVARDPRAAGVAGAITVVNDLVASGAEPTALLDTLVGPSEEHVLAILDGLRGGASLAGVPVVGGHTTLAPDAPALSVFGVGRLVAPLRAAAARGGDTICFAACLEGEVVSDADGQHFFSHLRGPRRDRLRDDLAVVLACARAGEAWAARDVSMPGLLGSLLQMLESAGGLGCEVDLAAVPRPDGIGLEQWLLTFPSYGFLLAGDPDALARRFGAAGLACAPLGTLDQTGRLRIRGEEDDAVLWDLGAEPLTGMGPRR